MDAADTGPEPVALANLDIEPILGLPAVLRLTVGELKEFVRQTHTKTDLATLCMQMYYVLMALSQDAFALDMQARALRLRRVYRITGPARPRLRLLAFMAQGNMLNNAPLDFMVAHNGIALDLVYVLPDEPLPQPLPAHDVAMVAIGENAAQRHLLEDLQALLQRWPRPVVNAPLHVLHCARDRACALLQGIPGLHYPHTLRVAAHAPLPMDFPLTLRPVDSQGGNGLERLFHADELAAYYVRHPANSYYVARYQEYQSDDGQYRKMRLLLIDGRPFLCHLAISPHWIVHYQSAGMENSAAKRAEEERAMADFEHGFARRHGAALAQLAQRLALDYVTVDCCELRDGTLLVFEVDSRGLVHAADPQDLYPYKPAAMQKAFDAFAQALEQRVAAGINGLAGPVPG